MSLISWILFFCVAGGVLSVLAAWLALQAVHRINIQLLVSYAVGALLGAVFLEVIPHAVEDAHHVRTMTTSLLLGILAFFVLEKLVLWRHCHDHHCDAHDAQPPGHDHGRSGLMILIGDTFHNFVDGVLIAGAFLQDVRLGIVTALAIVAHEIPQELGDFFVLIHSGYSRGRALFFNLLSSVATVFGGLLGYYALSLMHSWLPAMLGFAAASMIYVAVADLIPGLHKRTELKATVQQVSLIALGILSIWGVQQLISETV